MRVYQSCIRGCFSILHPVCAESSRRSFTFVPLGHKKLARWYLILAQHLEAGVPLANALRFSSGAGVPAREIEAVAALIEQGGSINDALRAFERWMPVADRRFFSAAAEAGRLPRVLRNLSARHAQSSSVKLRLLLASLYPLGVLHIGLLLFPVLRMINWEKGFFWDGSAYARALALTFLPLWGVLLTLGFLARRQSPVLGQLGRMLPLFRGYIKAQALADFSFGLGNFLDAGLPISRAWLAAGEVARSPELLSASQQMDTRIEHGEAPGSALSGYRCFPADFVALYRAGESTGQLEQNLFQLASLNQEQADHHLKLATLVYPGLLFLFVAGMVAYLVISFYSGYFKMLGDLAG